MDKKIIHNTSMPRSGSELLQVILHQNPEIYASTTSPLLEYQFGARNNYGLPEVLSQDPKLMQTAFISMCGSMAQAYYKPITDRPIVIDKNRGWSHYYEWVEQWTPNPKMICMVRDLRDIIASFERIYRANRHTPAGPDNPAELRNMTVGQRTQHWLTTQPVGLALQRTLDLFQKKLDQKILFVRYEDLCNNTEETIKQIYKYLELEPYTHKFTDLKKEVEENDSYFGVYGKHTVKPEIEPVKSQAWSDVLNTDIANYVKEQHKWYFDAFGY